ncbi:Uncharacterised protein [Yersinia rohdei]|nr:Uncharacterised protein [Yersinia rohdei]
MSVGNEMKNSLIISKLSPFGACLGPTHSSLALWKAGLTGKNIV